MGGCYSSYASSRKLRGARLSSYVLPITDPDASDRAAADDYDAVDADPLVAKTTAADFARRYVLGRELGRGEFGVTRRCKDAVTGEALACKTIRRHRRRGRAHHRVGGAGGAAAAAANAAAAAAHAADVRREVAIMRRMSARDGAAVVRLREAREDADGAVHLVMDLCEGGELFDRIVARGHYSERAAANLFRTIVDVVQLCHANGVIHRDLKPENFLFANKSEDSPLKVIDFGLSVFFNPGIYLASLLLPSPQTWHCQFAMDERTPHRSPILICMHGCRGSVHGGGGERVLHGTGGAEAELRPRGGRVERRRDPVHPPLRCPSLLGRQRREDRAGHPPRRHRLQPGAVAQGLRQRQGPRRQDARPGPGHPAHRQTSARAPVVEERGHGVERVAGGGGAGAAAAVLGDEQVQEEGAGGGGAEHAGGGAGQVRADVPPHGQGQERQPLPGGAHGRPPHQRPARPGVRDQDAPRGRRHRRQRHPRLRRVRHRHAAPQEDDQRRVPRRRLQLLRQGRQRLHRDRRAQGGARTQRAGHPRDHPRRRHRQGRPDQLPGVRAHDEVRRRLEERLTPVLQGQLQQPQPQALQRNFLFLTPSLTAGAGAKHIEMKQIN